MLKKARVSLAKLIQKAVEMINRKTHVRAYFPTVCNYVLIARMLGHRTKISTFWVDPFQIIKLLTDFMVKVEHLLNYSTSILHIR